jgi:hypothetical protein
MVPRLGQDCCLPNLFQYIIHQLFYYLILYCLDIDSIIICITHSQSRTGQSSAVSSKRITSSWQRITQPSSSHITFQFNQIHWQYSDKKIQEYSHITWQPSTTRWQLWVGGGGHFEILITTKILSSVSFLAFLRKFLWMVPHKFELQEYHTHITAFTGAQNNIQIKI